MAKVAIKNDTITSLEDYLHIGHVFKAQANGVQKTVVKSTFHK